MLTPTRDAGKRGQDAVDFYNMTRHSLDEGRQPIDLAVLETLGELVWPGGGGKEILFLVAEATAGKLPHTALITGSSHDHCLHGGFHGICPFVVLWYP